MLRGPTRRCGVAGSRLREHGQTSPFLRRVAAKTCSDAPRRYGLPARIVAGLVHRMGRRDSREGPDGRTSGPSAICWRSGWHGRSPRGAGVASLPACSSRRGLTPTKRRRNLWITRRKFGFAGCRFFADAGMTGEPSQIAWICASFERSGIKAARAPGVAEQRIYCGSVAERPDLKCGWDDLECAGVI